MKKLFLTAFLLVGSVGAALAGGAFSQYPQIGVPANTDCLSFGNNGVCNQFRPAGPNNLVGGAVLPSDTNNPNGQNPQTVLVPAVLTGSTTQDAAPLTGTTVALVAGTAKLLLDPAATIAALTVTLPPATALVDGEELSITSSQTVTALTVTPGTGSTLIPTITTVTSSAPINLVYHAATAKWVGG